MDVAVNYDTESVLHTVRRLKASRGNVKSITSDPGSQLIGASKELMAWRKDWSESELVEFGAKEGMQWNFIMANSQHQNGGSEVLVKLCKGVIKAFMQAMGDHILTLNELNTVMLETAHLVNSRPIGLKPNKDVDFEYLSPNSILLGKNSDTIDNGPFEQVKAVCTDKERFLLCQRIIDQFWENWVKLYFPTLLVRQKWHYPRRNLQVGDVCVMQDSNAVRGDFRLCRVSQVYPDSKGIVRNVEVTVAAKQDGSKVYKPLALWKLKRHVNNLIVIDAADESESENVVQNDDTVEADKVDNSVSQVNHTVVPSISPSAQELSQELLSCGDYEDTHYPAWSLGENAYP